MGTRGFIGFVVDGQEKIAYNHWDSYPSSLGLKVLQWLRDADLSTLPDRVRALRVVDEDAPVDEVSAKRLAAYTNTNVGARMTADGKTDDSLNWYQLLRECQGDIAATLDSGHILDDRNFPLDSLFCEWGYLVDLDAGVLEVYRGFQESPPTSGRWAGRPTLEEQKADYEAHLKWCRENGRDPWQPPFAKYFAVSPVASYPLTDLPADQDLLDLEEKVYGQ